MDADAALYRVWDRVASLRLTGDWTARKRQVLDIIAAERAALAAPAVTETADLRAALECLIVAFRRWHIDRHGYAPTVHDFRLMLDMAAGTSDTEEET